MRVEQVIGSRRNIVDVQKVLNNSNLNVLESEILGNNKQPSPYEQSLFTEAYEKGGELEQGYQSFRSRESLVAENGDRICHKSMCRLQDPNPQLKGDEGWQKNDEVSFGLQGMPETSRNESFRSRESLVAQNGDRICQESMCRLQGRSEPSVGQEENPKPAVFAPKETENLRQKAGIFGSSAQAAEEGFTEGAKGSGLFAQKQGETQPKSYGNSFDINDQKLFDKKSESLRDTKQPYKAQNTDYTPFDAQKNVAAAGVLPSADALMESLFAQRMLDPQQTVSETSRLSTDMTTLIERILVAEPSQGKQEVRITLADGLLKDAELTILRNADGQLNVRVSCNNINAFQTAVSARQGLVEALEAHGERVEVVIDRGESQDGNEGDSRQRSRGLQTLSWEPDNV